LQMREVIGRDRCVELFNTQHGLSLSPLHSTVEADRTIELRDNSLIMKKSKEKSTRSAKGPS
jgi:hypothetical protein